MTKSFDDEEFGPFGEASISLLEMLFPKEYEKIIIIDPTFSDIGRANIKPQFAGGDFFVLSSVENPRKLGVFRSDLKRFTGPSDKFDGSLDVYRYSHAFFATRDLSILTAWAQAEYAVVAFKGGLLKEHSEWLQTMRALEVVREIT